jgi:RNA polymerase sigma factor (sigma-70 family)
VKQDFAALISAAKAGDKEAGNQLYKLTCSSAYGTVRSIVSNELDIDDILQETYLHVFSRLDSVENPDKFQSWVNCIAANQTKDWLRKKKPSLYDDFGSGDEDDDSDYEESISDTDQSYSPQEQLDKKTMQEMFERIFGTLPEDQRLCIVMHFKENMTAQEIADTLDIPLPTVKSRILYAKKKIKASVEEEERRTGLKLYSGIPFILYMLRQQEIGAKVPPFSAISAKIEAASAHASTAVNMTAETGQAASAAGNAAADAAGITAKTGASVAGHLLAGVAAHPIIAAVVAAAVIISTSAAPDVAKAITGQSASEPASSMFETETASSMPLNSPVTDSAAASSAVSSGAVAYPTDHLFSDYAGKTPYTTSDQTEILSITRRLNSWFMSEQADSDGNVGLVYIKDDYFGMGVLCSELTYYTITSVTINSEDDCIITGTGDSVEAANIGTTYALEISGLSYDSNYQTFIIKLTFSNGQSSTMTPATSDDINDAITDFLK